MSNFILPQNFKADLQKEYAEDGHGFSVWVQNMGTQREQLGKEFMLWHYVIVVQDKMISAGAFRHDPYDRIMTNEAAANNLASFYENSEIVRQAIENFDSVPDVREKWNNPQTVADVMIKLVNYMFQALVTEGSMIQYDIVKASFGPDFSRWDVVLETLYAPGRMFRFIKTDGQKDVTVSTYVKAHEHRVNI